ncbi:MAG: hypothetical protein AAGK97_12410, partial [Bacteroidota bacterium]
MIYRKNDEERGNFEVFDFKHAQVNFEKIDLANNYIKINYITADTPDITIVKELAKELYQDTATLQYDGPFVEQQALIIDVGQVNVKDAIFKLDNHRKNRPPKPNGVIDWERLRIRDFNANLSNVQYKDLDFTGQVNELSLKSKSGFEIKEMKANQGKVTSTRLELFGLKLETGNSLIKDTLIFDYSDYYAYDEFEDRVNMNAKFVNSRLAVKDIMYFVPASVNSPFFEKNKSSVLYLDGIISGRVNRLRGRGITLRIPDQTYFKGNFKLRDITIPGEEVLNLEVEELRTKAEHLAAYIPDFNPPKNFYKLGDMNFYGRFDGTFQEFFAYGKLQTDLGQSDLDMKIAFNDQGNNAVYSGKMNLLDFDLGTWTGDPQFGLISASAQVNNGRGLTPETLNADLNGDIKSFTFRNYTYKNVIGEGKFNQKLFDGKFSIKDDHVDLLFDGTIDFTDSLAVLDFNAAVNKLDIKSLNLSNDDFVFSGDMDINLLGFDLAKIRGETQLNDFTIIRNG